MRQEVIDYLQGLNLGTYIVSSELPYSETGTPLYIKNLKKIYVDVDRFDSTPVISTLNGLNISNEITIVRVYLANDAKQIPSNYGDVVNAIRAGKDLDATQGFNRREAEVSTSYDADKLVTEIEIRYIKLT
jgi:hypothetical protein